MSKSDDTKERIARTFLECMETTPYGKINVSQLCERAHISRKTFYYHFEDKERLVRWICIQDLIEWAHSDTSDGPSSYVSLISFFIEKNRILYGHALLDMTPRIVRAALQRCALLPHRRPVGAFLRGEYGR